MTIGYQGGHGPPSPVAQLISAQLRAGGEETGRAAATITAALAATDGDRTRAARSLGVSLSSLMRWLEHPALQTCKASFPPKNRGCIRPRSRDAA